MKVTWNNNESISEAANQLTTKAAVKTIQECDAYSVVEALYRLGQSMGEGATFFDVLAQFNSLEKK